MHWLPHSPVQVERVACCHVRNSSQQRPHCDPKAEEDAVRLVSVSPGGGRLSVSWWGLLLAAGGFSAELHERRRRDRERS